jgi:O-antigen/teichoic acid export membrane protein
MKITHYIKNFSWLLLENIIKVVIGFIVTIYVIKYLGPEQFGMLSYALSIVAISAPFATLGTESILFRNIIKDNDNEKTLMQTVRYIRLVTSLIISSILLVVFYFYFDKVIIFYIAIILLLSVVLQSFMIYREYFAAFEKVKYITFSSIISMIVTNSYRVALILLKAKLIWFAVAYVIEKIVSIGSLKYFYQKISDNKKLVFDKNIAKQMIKDSWPLMFTTFAGVLYLQIDQVLIKYYLGFEQVGIYATAVKIIMLLYVIPTILSNILYPRIMQWHKELSNTEYIKKMNLIYFFNFLIAILILSFFILFGEWIMLFLFGEEFVASVEVLLIYSFGLIFVFFAANNNKLLMIDNLQKLMLGRNILGLILNIILNIILIPKCGINGAAYATVITEIFILLSYGLNERTRYIMYLQLKSFIYPIIYLKEKLS